MKKIVVFGAKNFEKRLKYYIENYSNDKVCAFCVDEEYLKERELCGLPIVSSKEIISKFPPDEYCMLVGIGYKNMNNLRMKKFNEFATKGYDFYNFIHPSVHIDKTVNLGIGNIIMSNVIFDYESSIGSCNIIECGTIISHECIIGNYNYFSPGVVVGGKAIIENNCFVGLNSTIRSAVKLRAYSLVGAGCYVDENTVEYGVYVPIKKTRLSKKSVDMEIIYKGEK